VTAIGDRHAVFLTSSIPRLDNLAPVMVSEHGRGFWTVLDPPRHGVDSRVAFLPEGPGLAALESPDLAETLAELLGRYDPTRDHLVVIFEGGAAYLYRLDGTEHATTPLLVVVPRGG
jgi:hypothetical protein